ncbi:hypothetical protein KSS87_001206 [Heliosperma pusillum]|nr:hypothetical protein KSS87_001206 [Heliosperma pusillum]
MRVGKSILVPSVKELANECQVQIPDKYVRSDLQHQVEHVDHLQVPVINLEAIVNGDIDELHRLDFACRDWGFFQVTNHGVDSSLVEKFKVDTQAFFNLPLEEKKKYWQSPSDVEGFGQIFVMSEEQKLDWADVFFLTTLPVHQRRPHLLPLLPLPFRETLENYSSELEKLAQRILEGMAKALKLESQTMKSLFGEGKQTMRMNYYPSCPQPEKVIGLTPHSDSVALTILLQLNEIEGLQVMKDGKWVSVKPLPDAFVVNIGDIMEMMSNGIYRSILHRAVVNATKERLSVATFYSPSYEMDVGPIKDLITPENPAKFRRISTADYFKGLFARPLDGKAYLDAMRISDETGSSPN